MTTLLTQRQIEKLDRLPADHRVVGERNGAPLVRTPTGEHLLVQPNGNTTPRIERVQSYLRLQG